MIKLKSEPGRAGCQRGSMMVFIAFMLIVFIALLALVIDMGYLYAERQDIVNVCDAIALAAASDLPESKAEALGDALRYARYNDFNGEIHIGCFLDPDTAVTNAQNVYSTGEKISKIIASLANSSYTMNYDYYVTLPLAAFSASDWDTDLVGSLAGEHPITEFTEVYQANKKQIMTIIAGCTTPEITAITGSPSRPGADPNRAFFVGITDASVNQFASSFLSYYNTVGARAVAYKSADTKVLDDLAVFEDTSGADFHASPMLAFQYLFIGSTGSATANPTVRALDPVTLAQVWKYQLSSTGAQGIQATATYSNGRLFVQSTNGYLYCLNAATGALVWQNSATLAAEDLGIEANVWHNSTPIAYDTVVIVAEMCGRVRVFNRDNGVQIDTFTATVGSSFISDPVMTGANPDGNYKPSPPDNYPMGNTFIVGSNDGKVYGLYFNPNTYTLSLNTDWATNPYVVGSQVRSPITVFSNRVYFGADNNKIYKLNAYTGALIWEYSTGLDPALPNLLGGITVEERWNGASTDKYLHFGDSDGYIYCLKDNGANATLSWSRKPGSGSYSSTRIETLPTVVEGKVYYVGRASTATGDIGVIYQMSASTGVISKTRKIDDDAHCAMVYNDGAIYFGADDSKVHRITLIDINTTGSLVQ